MLKILVREKNKNVERLSDKSRVSSYINNKDTHLWVDIQKPTQEEMAFLEKHFSFHPLAIEDSMTTIQRPKIDKYDNYLFIVLHAATLAPHKDKATSLELDTFVGENYIVTVHSKPIPSVTSTWERCLKNTGLMAQGAAHLFYFLADALVDNYFPILEKLDREIQKVEDSVFSNTTSQTLSKIFELKENVFTLRKILGPQREAMNILARG